MGSSNTFARCRRHSGAKAPGCAKAAPKSRRTEGRAMQLVPGSERIVANAIADPATGIIRWAAAKSLWIGSMTLGALALGPIYFSWSAFLLFVVTSGITLCAGHSVGMH